MSMFETKHVSVDVGDGQITFETGTGQAGKRFRDCAGRRDDGPLHRHHGQPSGR